MTFELWYLAVGMLMMVLTIVNRCQRTALLLALKQRFSECGLELHPEKLKLFIAEMESAKFYARIRYLFFWDTPLDLVW